MTEMTVDDLIARLEAASGPDRDLDADIAGQLLGWKPFRVGKDANGENDCEVLTPDGKAVSDGFTYPPLGKIHRGYHVPAFTRDIEAAVQFSGPITIELPTTARKIMIAALKAHAKEGTEDGR